MIVTEYMKIHIKIDGIKYPMTILRKDEFLYREAAKMVNEKINLYRLNYKDAGCIQQWVMTAFDIAFEIVSIKENEITYLKKKIEEQTKELEKYKSLTMHLKN